MNLTRRLTIAILAALTLGCSDAPTSPDRASASGPFDRLFIFARTTTEDVEFALVRDSVGSTTKLFRQAREGRPRILLDSIGPGAAERPQVVAMLEEFDLWALNAPNAPGAACRTVNGQRSCNITVNDYSIVMLVERGGEVRVQRYTGLERSSGHPAARALGDFVLAWARELEGGT